MIICSRDVNKYSKSPISTPFNVCKALDDRECSVSIGGWHITNFNFADGIVVNADEDEEADVLKDRLDTTTTKLTKKVMTNNPNGFQNDIKINSQRLEAVGNFKYLGSIISNE